MAIKVQGSTIIDDSRNIINATQVGIATTNPTSKLTVVGDVLVSGIVTAASFRGDGSQLFGVSGGVSISTNTTNQNQFLTYAISTGTTTGLGVTTSGLVFNPSTTRFGIGITNPQYTFTVTDTGTPATTGLTNCLADFTTTANSYGQINLRNTSTGTNASSDVIITADNGNDSSNFIDLGINNSGFSVGSWTINGANDGYLYTSDGNLSIGAINASVAKYISFFTGGTLLSNERMRINSTGVGIGTTNPTSKLTVQGDVLVSGASTLGTVQISSGIVTATTGIVTYYGDGSKLTGISASQRNTNSFTATEGQTTFIVSYTPGYIDVYLNGSRLSSAEYTATNGTSIILSVGASVNDVIETVSIDFLGEVQIATASGLTGTPNIVVGVVTATQYFGDGSNLTGISGGGSIQIRNQGTLVGTSITAINFSGPGISSIASSSGISTIVITGSQRTVNTFTATEGQTNFNTSYAPSAVDVYLNGSRLSSAEYIAVDGSTIVLSTGASVNDIIEVVSFTSVGSIAELTSQFSTTSGISSSSLGLTGTPNITVGVVTATSITVGVVTATQYFGDGSNLTGISAGGGSGSIQIRNQGTLVGTSITAINFSGPGISTIATSSGISTIVITGSQRTVNTFTATEGQTNFNTTYTPSAVDVYLNGARINSSEYIAVDGSTIVLSTGASVNDIIEVVSFTSVGSIAELTSQFSTTSGISSSSLGLTGTPNITVGVVTASNYYGNGSNLSNVIGQISVSNQGTFVGSGITAINFVGAGVSSVVSLSGIATVSFVGSQRNTASFVATSGQTIFNTNYTVGFVDVYKDGTRLSSSQFTATDGVTIVLSSGATVGQVIDVITVANVSNNITNSDDTRIQSVSEKINITSGNTVSLVYNTGSGNVGLATNPTGDITLNVTGIPIDSSFDSRQLKFSVIVTQTGIARSCTAITLNGVSRTIKWSGGSLSGAITKGGNTNNGYDIYNFIGINTVGSASTTTNYVVLGSINGGFS